MIQSIHTAIPGRARYKVEGLYRSESLKQHLEAGLVAIESIHAVSASAFTGNILVHFDPARSAADIMALLDGVVTHPVPPSRQAMNVKYAMTSCSHRLETICDGIQGQASGRRRESCGRFRR
jgi:Heavy metal associated domain 2